MSKTFRIYSFEDEKRIRDEKRKIKNLRRFKKHGKKWFKDSLILKTAS